MLSLPLVAAHAASLPDTEDAREHSIAAHRVVHAAQRVVSLVAGAAQPLLAARDLRAHPSLARVVRCQCAPSVPTGCASTRWRPGAGRTETWWMEVDTGHGASAHRPAMLDGIKGCRHIFNMCGEIWWWVSRRAAPAIFGFFGHNLQVSGAERRHFLVGPFTYSVSGETPAGWSAGRFWGLCVASVKFSTLAAEGGADKIR